ncbi:MAG: hypothetical protein ACR2NN_26150 [Bryobacteraceae bacterium]
MRRSSKAGNTTVNRLPIQNARLHLGAVAQRAHLNGEYFILEQDGIPVAGIMDADELEDYLELQNPKVKKQIDESRKDYEAGRVRDVRELLEDLRAGAKHEPRKTRKRA